MFVFDPDPYLLPAYRISPFTTGNVAYNHLLPENNFIDSYFSERFAGKFFYYTSSGRSAIYAALQQYNLMAEDVVTILTSSGNFYVSSCITSQIEKLCRWSREIEPQSKIIFVVHEFGYPYGNMQPLKNYNLPIIEDCAYSFFSADSSNAMGNTGGHIIYSFPKMFPLQAGGLLVSKNAITNVAGEIKEQHMLQYVKNILSHYIPMQHSIAESRISNYQYLIQQLSALGFAERFVLHPGIVPGVCMFKKEHNHIDLNQLKLHLYAHGIQCSVFYGEETFFIPVHQNLQTPDLDYLVESIKKFCKKSHQ